MGDVMLYLFYDRTTTQGIRYAPTVVRTCLIIDSRIETEAQEARHPGPGGRVTSQRRCRLHPGPGGRVIRSTKPSQSGPDWRSAASREEPCDGRVTYLSNRVHAPWARVQRYPSFSMSSLRACETRFARSSTAPASSAASRPCHLAANLSGCHRRSSAWSVFLTSAGESPGGRTTSATTSAVISGREAWAEQAPSAELADVGSRHGQAKSRMQSGGASPRVPLAELLLRSVAQPLAYAARALAHSTSMAASV